MGACGRVPANSAPEFHDETIEQQGDQTMRTFLKLAAAFGLAVCLASSANAQGQGGGLNLLTNKSVQKELKLTDEQIEKATKASVELTEKFAERRAELRDMEPAERQEKSAAMNNEIGVESKKAMEVILKPEQTKRFDQIALQAQGYRAFNMPQTQTKLKLTDEQKTKIKEMADEAQAQMREIFQSAQNGGDRAEMMKKMTELNKTMNEKGASMLTDDQKKSWKDMTGEPFTVVQEPRRPGGNN